MTSRRAQKHAQTEHFSARRRDFLYPTLPTLSSRILPFFLCCIGFLSLFSLLFYHFLHFFSFRFYERERDFYSFFIFLCSFYFHSSQKNNKKNWKQKLIKIKIKTKRAKKYIKNEKNFLFFRREKPMLSLLFFQFLLEKFSTTSSLDDPEKKICWL